MPKIINGTLIADKLLKRLALKVRRMRARNIVPRLAVVLIGNDPASLNYITRKRMAAELIGVDFLFFHFKSDFHPSSLIRNIKNIQHRHHLSALIIQLPLPPRLQRYQTEIIRAINPSLDVDCLSGIATDMNTGGERPFLPPTPSAILEILKKTTVLLEGKHIVLVGRGELIGKPLVNLLMSMPIVLTVCGRAARPLAHYTRQADIIISGVGKERLITGSMVKQGAIVIDAGFSMKKGKIQGDIEFASVKKKASIITPVPGGVGPITVAKLLENVVNNAMRLHKKARLK